MEKKNHSLKFITVTQTCNQNELIYCEFSYIHEVDCTKILELCSKDILLEGKREYISEK